MSLRMSSWRLPLIYGFFLSISFVSIFIAILVYGVNSDSDNLHPSIVRLLPAGHSMCKSAPVFESNTCLDLVENQSLATPHSKVPQTWQYQYGRDDNNEGLDEEQCISAFPGLFDDIHRAKDLRKDKPFTLVELENVKMFPGMAKAMIFDGELYVVEVSCMGDDHRKKIIAILASIRRSISSIPDSRDMPNIIFTFTVEDMADDPTVPGLWTLARRADDVNLWLMPDFGLWSWDLVGLGPYDEVVGDIIANETSLSWAQKSPRVVWRGKLSFAPKIRHALLDAARDKSWADVAPVIWTPSAPAGVGTNALAPLDQCSYQFVAHAEGRSYSASLKYRQACNSVVISHKLQWLQHHHYLLSSKGPHQNFVEVERDFSDLNEKVRELLLDSEKAERIAANSVKTFRERYLTRAAGACYWRSLIKGWAQASQGVEVKKKRGMRFENFILLKNEKQLKFP